MMSISCLGPTLDSAIGIRPEDVNLRHDPSAPNLLETRVLGMEYCGSLLRIDLKPPFSENQDAIITADVPTETVRRLDISPDTVLPVHLPVDRPVAGVCEQLKVTGLQSLVNGFGVWELPW